MLYFTGVKHALLYHTGVSHDFLYHTGVNHDLLYHTSVNHDLLTTTGTRAQAGLCIDAWDVRQAWILASLTRSANVDRFARYAPTHSPPLGGV